MGKLGRFACIFTPMALTIGSLVCLVLVALGGTNMNNSFYNDLYFFRANTSDITIDPSDLPGNISLPNNAITDKILGSTTSAVASAMGIYDFYHVSLWNYCAGNFTTVDGHVTDHVTYCSPHTNAFWFNPIDVWHLNNTVIDKELSTEIRGGLNTYHTVSRWMFIAYVVALVSTAAEVLIGFTALLSRIGSIATSIVSAVSTAFTFAFALTATILYGSLTGTFNHALTKYNIHGNLGHDVYVLTWLAVAFSVVSGFFWLLSSCCCSGRSDRIKGYDKDGRAPAIGGGWGSRRNRGRGRGAYNKVAEPMMGGMNYSEPPHGYQSQTQPHGYASGGQETGRVGRQDSYEPFRHV